MSELFEDIAAFAAQQLGVHHSRLAPDVRLQHDLGVDGADGWKFMAAFGTRFSVDMTRFEANRHFGPETGGQPLLWLWWSITRSWPRHVPITVADLVAAARAGRWDTPTRAAV
jgi:hypothetical protein